MFPDSFRALMRIVLILLEALIQPTARVLAGFGLERGVHLPVVARNEVLDRLLAFHHDREGWGLHAANRCQEKTAPLGIERRHGACAVDAHQPVRLAAARGSTGQG